MLMIEPSLSLPSIYSQRRRRLLKTFITFYLFRNSKRARCGKTEILPTNERWKGAMLSTLRYLDLLFCFKYFFSGCFWTLTSYFFLSYSATSVVVDIFLLFCCNHNSLPFLVVISTEFLSWKISLLCFGFFSSFSVVFRDSEAFSTFLWDAFNYYGSICLLVVFCLQQLRQLSFYHEHYVLMFRRKWEAIFSIFSYVLHTINIDKSEARDKWYNVAGFASKLSHDRVSCLASVVSEKLATTAFVVGSTACSSSKCTHI